MEAAPSSTHVVNITLGRWLMNLSLPLLLSSMAQNTYVTVSDIGFQSKREKKLHQLIQVSRHALHRGGGEADKKVYKAPFGGS